LLGGLGSIALIRAQEPVFRSDVNVVNILATVRDKSGAYIRNLASEDFTVLESGRPQTIRYFTRETGQPLTLGLLIDTSLSQERVIDAERGAALRFLDEVLRETMDRIFVVQFDTGVSIAQKLTASRKDLEESLSYVNTPSRAELQRQGEASTRLYDAVIVACRDILAGQSNRKAIIVLSDGVDTGSDHSLESAVTEAQRADAVVYSVLFSDANAYGTRHGPAGSSSASGRKALTRLANETGGAAYEVSKKLSIDQVFETVQAELRSQYSIGFVSGRPAEAVEYRRLTVTTKRPGLTVQARGGYWTRP